MGKVIIMGMANKFSIAYGIAKELRDNGAELIFTVASDYFRTKIKPIIDDDFPGSEIFICNVTEHDGVQKAFQEIQKSCGCVKGILHSIAFSDKNELRGRYIDTSRSNFTSTLEISCFSFVEVCKCSEDIINKETGGSLLTLSYYGAAKAFPNYNVMGVAKAALEASVIYAARDLGELNIRVNAISAGPIKTLAASGVGDFSKILAYNCSTSPLKRNVTLADVGKAALFLLSDMGSGVTGEIMYVDCGCNVIGMPPLL
jgi:enoyl-[acyl-carrier protein] reductase I